MIETRILSETLLKSNRSNSSNNQSLFSKNTEVKTQHPKLLSTPYRNPGSLTLISLNLRYK